ncbi:MAG: hypothetical protein L6R28_25520 [Planctomycetes bacterium]|nr:hypothetical protein [Planctomycetota bacterium]
MKNTDLLLRVQSLKLDLEAYLETYRSRDTNAFMKWKVGITEKHIETVKLVEEKLIAAIRRDGNPKEASHEVDRKPEGSPQDRPQSGAARTQQRDLPL